MTQIGAGIDSPVIAELGLPVPNGSSALRPMGLWWRGNQWCRLRRSWSLAALVRILLERRRSISSATKTKLQKGAAFLDYNSTKSRTQPRLLPKSPSTSSSSQKHLKHQLNKNSIKTTMPINQPKPGPPSKNPSTTSPKKES